MQGIGGVPLGVAAEKGHTETVTKLIEAGVTVNYQNNVCTTEFPLLQKYHRKRKLYSNSYIVTRTQVTYLFVTHSRIVCEGQRSQRRSN